ncbi:MAG: smalltalk protein [Bacteroidaceae bacterium]|nr:smalltalk protein [Bacteroidaceae bacterium]
MKNKQFWKTVIQFAISILTAALTAMGTTSCMGHGPIIL